MCFFVCFEVSAYDLPWLQYLNLFIISIAGFRKLLLACFPGLSNSLTPNNPIDLEILSAKIFPRGAVEGIARVSV